ncbi:MAG: DUF4412 domain-containing protein [Bacteroidetes bacterium]|nr:DUF4412 domain-containing protein [Bacteroidota bacterium]
MKKIQFLIAALFTCTLSAFAQGFSGTIEFNYSTVKDTTKNIYYIKSNKVKLENYGKKSGNIEGSFLFDFTTNKIVWINPKRKMWGDHKSETPPIIRGTCVVSKGGSKKILGYTCQEYVVKNTEENTSITYWIASDKFNFFMPMLKMWNRKDKQSIYFSKIEGLPEGSMPLYSEEKTINDNASVSRLESMKINKTSPDDSHMQIPADYNRMDK